MRKAEQQQVAKAAAHAVMRHRVGPSPAGDEDPSEWLRSFDLVYMAVRDLQEAGGTITLPDTDMARDDGRARYVYEVDCDVDPTRLPRPLDETCDRVYEGLLDHGLEPVMSSATDAEPVLTLVFEVRARSGSGAVEIAQALLGDALRAAGAVEAVAVREARIAMTASELLSSAGSNRTELHVTRERR